ncbi:MAG: T9SS type A sorting domain-containing protein, partial [Candidatus Riflebacteria bacterium]|nr:T9SS type A sorting domain-containing protein [Candidatus Riflebacteria bacterium]
DSDQTGFELVLKENGTHSELFRNFINISPQASDKNAQTLKVLPGQKIEIISLTDPAIRTSVRYQPENSIRLFAVYPSPARGNSVTFRFYLNFATDVHLEIFDVAGDKIRGFNIRGQEGENSYTWQLPAHLANGVYFFQVEIAKDSPYATGKRKNRGKFAVLR